MFSNHPTQPSRVNSNKVRVLWRTFEKWLSGPRANMEQARDKAILLEENKWRQTPTRTRCSQKQHQQNKDALRRKYEEEHYTAAREEWQKRLAAMKLKDEDWFDMNPMETRAVENALGAHLAFEEDEQDAVMVENVVPSPPIPQVPSQPQPPSQTTAPAISINTRSVNSSASSYAMVNPRDLSAGDEDSLFYKVAVPSGTVSEDEDLGIPTRGGWATESSGYTTTWSTDSHDDSAQSSKTGSPEPPPHRPLGFDFVQQPSFYSRGPEPVSILPKRPPDASGSNVKAKARLPGPAYIGPRLSDPTEPFDEEADFEDFKMKVRVQKIVEFHEAAVKVDIALALQVHNARKTKNSGKGEDLSMMREHEQRMRELQITKEEERKEIVATERKRRRDEIKRRGPLRDPGRMANTAKTLSWQNTFDEAQLHADLQKKFDISQFLPQVQEPEVKEPENPYVNMQSASFSMFDSTYMPQDVHQHQQAFVQSSQPSMWKTAMAESSSSSMQTRDLHSRLSGYHQEDVSDEEDEDDEEVPAEFMDALMESGGIDGTQWTPFGEEPEVKAKPATVASGWGTRTSPHPPAHAPSPAPGAVASGWAKKPSPVPPVASGWAKKSSLVTELSGRDTPSSQTKKTSPPISLNPNAASKWKLESQTPEVPEPAPAFPAPKGKQESAWGSKKISPPVVESPKPKPPVPTKIEKAAPAPPPPAPAAVTSLASKKMNKKQRLAMTKKAGGSVNAQNSEPEVPAPAVEESSPEPEVEEEEEISEPMHAKSKMEEFASTPRQMSKNPFFETSNASPFKWDDGPATPRPSNVRRLSNAQEPSFLRADQTIRQSGLRKQWQPSETQGATSSRTTLDQPASRSNTNFEVSSPDFWTPDAAASAWGASDNESIPAKAPAPPARPSLHEIWVPGGSAGGAGTRQMWNPPSDSRSPKIEKSTSMPTQRGQPAAAGRLRRLSDPGSPSPRFGTKDLPSLSSRPEPTPASILKKAKGKKNGKGKQVTIEEISDEEGDAGPNDWTEKLPSDSRIIMEPKPSAPPTAFSSIIQFGDGEGQEEEVQGNRMPWGAGVEDPAEDDQFASWLAAAARELQQGTAQMEKLHGGVGDHGMLKSKQVHWTGSVVGGDSPSPQVFNSSRKPSAALELEEESSLPVPGNFRRAQPNTVVQPPKIVEKVVPVVPPVEQKPKVVPDKKGKGKANGKRR